jgi:hypothetical protein
VLTPRLNAGEAASGRAVRLGALMSFGMDWPFSIVVRFLGIGAEVFSGLLNKTSATSPIVFLGQHRFTDCS